MKSEQNKRDSNFDTDLASDVARTSRAPTRIEGRHGTRSPRGLRAVEIRPRRFIGLPILIALLVSPSLAVAGRHIGCRFGNE